MRFKYYLRGIGLGIIFATIVMGVASTNNKVSLTDKEIIEKAKELGMVMPESSGGLDDLFGDSNKNTEKESETEIDTETDPETDSELDSETGTDIETDTESEIETEDETTTEPSTEEQ